MEGFFRPIGSDGFYSRDGARADYDQQSVEAQAMVSAALVTYRVTADPDWNGIAKRVFEWFLGRNDPGIPLYDLIPGAKRRILSILKHALTMSDDEVAIELDKIREEFASRHFDPDGVLSLHYRNISHHVRSSHSLSSNRKLLIGALFSGEYALESAALFNPSIVPHPDQTGVVEGCLRFIMSLRATGEGHISSIEFRSGRFASDGDITIDPTPR